MYFITFTLKLVKSMIFISAPRLIISRINILLLLILSLLITACDSTDNIPVQQVDSSKRLTDIELQQQKLPQAEKNTYYFGFDLRASPQEDAAQYIPFLNYLEITTGYHFNLYFTPDSSSLADEIGHNRIQFAAMGATSFLYAQTRYAAKSLALGLNKQNKAVYQSVFVVRPGSSIKKISDIKGHKLAFGNRDSTQGHLIPRIMLNDNNLSLKDLSAYSYTGSHQNCVESVVSGKFDVCGMQDQLAKKIAAEGLIKIIHQSRYYPSSGIVVSKSVPKDVAEKVKQALLNFEPQGKDSQNLYHWERTEMPNGFIASKDDDYELLREWSIKLGFLMNDRKQEPVK